MMHDGECGMLKYTVNRKNVFIYNVQNLADCDKIWYILSGAYPEFFLKGGGAGTLGKARW